MQATEIVQKVRAWLRGNPPKWFRVKFRDGTIIEVREFGVFSMSPDGKKGLTHTAEGRDIWFDVEKDLETVELLEPEEERAAG